MTNDRDDDGTPIFAVWKRYEKIAVHFNELIMQWRIRALAGVAGISALVGFLAKDSAADEFKWGTLTVVFIMLLVAWIAIWALDKFYYSRLLAGAVEAILLIEKKSAEGDTRIHGLDLSIWIEKAVKGELRDKRPHTGRYFYGLITGALVFGLLVSSVNWVWALCQGSIN